jgi:hypothetical protein
MWYPTAPENQQNILPGEAKAEQQSDSRAEQSAPATHSEKVSTVTIPGSEYWLP